MSKVIKSKVSMHAVPPLRETGALQGARRATEDAPISAAPVVPSNASSEVVVVARRGHFSTADKRRILAAADRCTKPGEISALMRREGVYSSSLSTWRRQREVAGLAVLAPQKRGPKHDPVRADAPLIAQLTRDNLRLQTSLNKANLVIEVQEEMAVLLGLATPENGNGNEST